MHIPDAQVTDFAGFQAVQASGQPVVMRGLVKSWPAVAQGGSGASIARYLSAMSAARQTSCVFGPNEINGRFFYRPDMRGFNFGRRDATVAELLRQLLVQAETPAPLFIAMQSAATDQVLPGFAEANPMPLLPAEIRPRIWIGNRIKVATHYDSSDNIACVIAGRRRFTLFPPEQVANLYPGPLEMTPAGTPVSMVDPDEPNLDRYPRFAKAASHMMTAELEPGDAIFIPYLWWHAVTSLDPVSVLINYWWNDEGPDGYQVQAMLHALLAFKGASPRRLQAWARMYGHFVFHESVDPGAHIPVSAVGVLGSVNNSDRVSLLQRVARSMYP